MSNSVEQDGQVEDPEGDASCCDAACSCNARGLSTNSQGFRDYVLM